MVEVSILSLPIILKPTDSSGSKGVTVLKTLNEFNSARDYAASVTRSGVLIAEEFIVRDHPDVIEAEIFISHGKVAVWELMNTVRDVNTNPLLPAAYTYPLNISQDRNLLVRKEISRLVACSGIQHGAMNIEMVIDKNNNLYFLDAGPRSGGNELPEFIGRIVCGDIVEMTIKTAMGEDEGSLSLDGDSGGFWGMYVLHSNKEGSFSGVSYDGLARKFLLFESLFKKSGDHISAFRISRDAIGLVIFRFPDMETRDEIMNDFKGKHIKVILSELE